VPARCGWIASGGPKHHDEQESSAMNERLTPQRGLSALQNAGKEFITLFHHGSLDVEIYRPQAVDRQKPHSRDEIYVVISGTGTYFIDGRRQPFEPGEILFAPAGAEHRFENFTSDFATWVFFYGPEGGERA
jgi:mannose-6-phosphate isomerase-like protein (cupin superfamily)